jgi:hypothetical protein
VSITVVRVDPDSVVERDALEADAMALLNGSGSIEFQYIQRLNKRVKLTPQARFLLVKSQDWTRLN